MRSPRVRVRARGEAGEAEMGWEEDRSIWRILFMGSWTEHRAVMPGRDTVQVEVGVSWVRVS